ncbi:MAG: hypothetical protein ACJ79U_14640 [Myxococcales bacterium]
MLGITFPGHAALERVVPGQLLRRALLVRRDANVKPAAGGKPGTTPPEVAYLKQLEQMVFDPRGDRWTNHGRHHDR